MHGSTRELIVHDYNRCIYYTDEDAFTFGGFRRWSAIFRSFLFDKGFRAVVFHRVSSRMRSGHPIVLALIRLMEVTFTSIEIHPTATIGPGLFIPHAQCIVIGKGAAIGRNVTINQGVTIGGMPGKQKDGRGIAVIGDNVLIGAGSIVLGPITIGNNAIIGANAVVLSDIPSDSVAVGVPAKVVGSVTLAYPDLLKMSSQEA